ncbi:hypothetical protein ACQRIT_007162 [Beauveria bassiana]
MYVGDGIPLEVALKPNAEATLTMTPLLCNVPSLESHCPYLPLLHHLPQDLPLAQPGAFLIDVNNARPLFHGDLVRRFLHISYTCSVDCVVNSAETGDSLGNSSDHIVLTGDIDHQYQDLCINIPIGLKESCPENFQPQLVFICKTERGASLCSELGGTLGPDS